MDSGRLQFSGDSWASEPINGAAYPEGRRQSLSPEPNYFGGDDPAIAALRRFQNMSAVSNRRAQEGADTERRPSTNQKGAKPPKQEKDKIDPPRSRLETIFFSVLHSMVTGNEVHSSFAIPFLLFEDIQLLYFAWHPGFKFSGMPDWIIYLFNPLVYRPPPGYYALFIVMFSAAWLLVAILIGTITFCAIR
ncbi:hypothetical protein M427DRAFT_133954 [Gonapodya prolifera JEL478]|uniref:Uncharacterized protein n=1 Tax=Gonapodya prolifera (strain JEL478) TaxID=1344416 RepID=A0A139AIM6_GONPJ|nr:hypothetical protein M427DRAFT_133954 [Gonapodya prolifera JEL478]|eukprot:KXS16598.1 hypothetical protein M427DRAFT_133954 [Gonapodya prolifera JEL478]